VDATESITMKDVIDLNPDMTPEDCREWAEETNNSPFAEYLRRVANDHE
jgi:hypothetical protein